MCKRDIQHIHLLKTRHTTCAFSQCKLKFVRISPMPFSLYEKLITPYSFEIALSVLGGNGRHHIGQCRPNGNSRAGRLAATLPYGMVRQLRAWIGSPCQRPGPLLLLSLPSSRPPHVSDVWWDLGRTVWNAVGST